MKLLLDEHLSRKLVPLLEAAFPETAHVTSLQLDTKTDDDLWKFAKLKGFTMVTKGARGISSTLFWWRFPLGSPAAGLCPIIHSYEFNALHPAGA